MIRYAIVTASDKGSRGEREDKSAPVIRELMEKIDGKLISYEIVPDEETILEETLIKLCNGDRVDLILTTGGTGFAPRDVTPEATRAVCEKLVPGLGEAMRQKSLEVTPKAMLSRGIAGIRGKTLIVNLPGSPKAVRECLEVIMPALPHGIEILRGEASECAR
ncbi:MAG: molybdopterin adenylyltransferase [Clostridia bacterium]|nr:MogA/MoaB family molybdenum cofactor biosynthesis protein [Clostridiales bacterium]MDK2984804.1 molybdopterin adenylyltransferase [Clostridia bacterium]